MRLFAIILLAGALSACKSADGVYLPGCAAYAGDRIELDDGSFTWDKFTDQVKVDDAGNRVDPFPGYPMTGTYRVEAPVVTMVIADTGASETLHLHRVDGRLLLLTAAQQADWESSGRYDDCALTRSNEE